MLRKIAALICLILISTCANAGKGRYVIVGYDKDGCPILGPKESHIPAKSLRWAERLLKLAEKPITQWGTEYWPNLDQAMAVDAYQELIRKYGYNVKAYQGLGRSFMLQGKYKEAVSAFNSISYRSPSATRDFNLASSSLAASKAASKIIPKSLKVIRVAPYPIPGQKGIWAVLSGKWDIDKKTTPDMPYYMTFNNLRIDLMKQINGNFVSIWHESNLGSKGYTDGEFSDVQLCLADLTKDGQQEIIIPGVFLGASWMPSHMDIFTWRSGKMIKLLGLGGHDPIIIKDLNHDGKYEVMNDFAIGWSPCHAEQPRWVDVYAYKNGTYQLADADFPWIYRDLAREIRTVLRHFPDDWQLLKYQAIIYHIQRRPELARRYLAKALKQIRSELAGETDSKFTTMLKYEQKEIGRLQKRY